MNTLKQRLSSNLTLILLMFFSITLVSGCTTLPNSPAIFNQSPNSQIQFVDFPSERRGAWFVKVNNEGQDSYRVCAEPPTDTGLSTSQLLNITADLKKLANTNVGLDSSVVSNLYELKGRTPAVLALRDVMYRMCESRLQKKVITDADFAAERDVYKKIVEVIGEFAKADLNSAQEQKAIAVSAINPTGVSEQASVARAKEQEGIAAIGQKEWVAAKKAFDDCEQAYPSFRACYELSNALEKPTDSQKATALLKHKSFLPNRISDMLQDLSSK